MDVNNTGIALGGPNMASAYAADAIIAAAQAGLGNGLVTGEVAVRGSMNKHIDLHQAQKSGGGGGGGLFGFLGSILKPIASLVSFIPGFGTMASFVLNLASGVLSMVGSAIETGKVKASQVLETVGNAVIGMIPGGALTGLGGMGVKMLTGMLTSGRIDPSAIAAGLGKVLEGIPGGGVARLALDAGSRVMAQAMAGGKFDPTALLQTAAQVAGGTVANGGEALAAIAGQFDAGALPSDRLVDLLKPIIKGLGLEPAQERLLQGLLQTTATALQNGDLTARDAVRAMTAGVGDHA